MIPQVILLLLLSCPEGQASSSVFRNVPLNAARLKHWMKTESIWKRKRFHVYYQCKKKCDY